MTVVSGLIVIIFGESEEIFLFTSSGLLNRNHLMDLKILLHKISYLKWVFTAAQIVLILYSFIILPDNLVSIIGIIIFITGIQLGLDSLSDMDRMSQKEKARYSTTNYAKQQAIIVLSVIIVVVLISILFLSLKFVFPSNNNTLFNTFFDLGLDCWALILGLLCLLKSIYDKDTYVKSIVDN